MLVFRIKESDPLIDNWHGFKMSRDPFRFNVFLASINLHKVANYASWGGGILFSQFTCRTGQGKF